MSVIGSIARTRIVRKNYLLWLLAMNGFNASLDWIRV